MASAGSLLVDADTGLMTILLENLLDNAWKFTAHAELPRVELGAIDAGGQRAFFVKDNGVGRPPHRRAPRRNCVGRRQAPGRRRDLLDASTVGEQRLSATAAWSERSGKNYL
jgi:hypothetical protein